MRSARLIGIALALALLPAAADATPCVPGRTILVLHSYAPDYTWTRDLQTGIERRFASESCQPHLRTEYMDTKNVHADAAYLQQFADLLAAKYRGVTIDGILTVDNNAFDFIQDYGTALFGRAPTVSIGVNGYEGQPLQPPVQEILPERADHASTLRQAISQTPGTEHIYVIIDETATGIAIGQEVEETVQREHIPVPVTAIEGLSLPELLRFAEKRRKGDVLYLIPFFHDGAGRAFPDGFVASRLAAASPVPVYVSWSSQIGSGAVGGRVISGEAHGAHGAARLWRRVDARGAAVSDETPESDFQDLYDFAAIKRFGIPITRLPADVTFVNRPEDFLTAHARVLGPATMIIAVLIALLGLAAQNLSKQRQINQGNARILSMNREIIDTQRELVAMLGEVIEARSLETASHVKRVAAISRFLGGKVGLSPQELDILEAASPMHDVGKIGVPETILHKPGPLTAEEFEVVKTHTTIGHNILKTSKKPLMRAASVIALQHHEHWDGTGYPAGLRGEEIAMMARITTLADVFDALLSERCYKPAWPEETALRHIASLRGTFFDPELVDILLAHIDTVREIRNGHPAAAETPVFDLDPSESGART